MDMKVDIEFIKQARTDKNWTQQQLADICNLSLRTIQRIEKEGIASHESVASLSSAFEVDKQLFVSEKDPNEPLDNKSSATVSEKETFRGILRRLFWFSLNTVAVGFLVLGATGLYNSHLDSLRWFLIALVFSGGVLLTMSIMRVTKSNNGG